MRLLRFCFVLAGLVFGGCGGRVDDGPGTDSSATNPESGCPAGCDHMHACASQIERDGCMQACEKDFARPEAAQTWGACISQLSCDEIQRGLGMNYGPIGECYTKAQRQP